MRRLAYFLNMIATFAIKRTVAFAILAFWACCFGSTQMVSALAAKTEVVSGEDGRYPLGPYLFYLEDPAGHRRPFSAGEVAHRLSVFLLDVPSGSERTLYLRFETKGVLLFEPVLWRADAFFARTSRHNLFFGAFLGALCIMGTYNLFRFGTQKGAHRAVIMPINKVVEQIGKRDRTLADNLAKLAEYFEYDELLALIRKDQIGEDG